MNINETFGLYATKLPPKSPTLSSADFKGVLFWIPPFEGGQGGMLDLNLTK